jgi:hypothetical protein
MFSFGYFPGVRLSFADVSEPSVRSIFKGLKNLNLTLGKYPKEDIQNFIHVCDENSSYEQGTYSE